MKPTVSVIIPTFNRPDDLKRAIESVYAQTHQVDEVWVINDGDTYASFLDLKTRFGGVNILHTGKGKGANFSRNLGIKNAISDILMFLDDDDWWTKDKVDRQLRLFEADDSLGLVFSGKQVVFDHTPEKVQYQITAKDVQYPLKAILKDNFIGTTSSVAVRRNLVIEAGLFDESLPAMQDYDLWIRICKRAKVKSDRGYHVFYTVNKSSQKIQISKSGINQLKASEIIFEKYTGDFLEQGIRLSRRKGQFYFKIAKSIRYRSFWKAVPWIAKSFVLYPSIKAIYLLISTERPF
ncbi:MAG: glycosyltransferase family 2 protein [Lunatimonas sp.]|uniref:glycosyltransferase family 2 protein n=1 Tax=Lunatimonas sp. TaxID=2060141 RepID=UPI00263AE779|nr:glycosyltransferase family A protein [Lunatimonas sp.]MCC5937195.1 glycosyltransferase family 2 protein [Lunatimonas sp.]